MDSGRAGQDLVPGGAQQTYHTNVAVSFWISSRARLASGPGNPTGGAWGHECGGTLWAETRGLSGCCSKLTLFRQWCACSRSPGHRAAGGSHDGEGDKTSQAVLRLCLLFWQKNCSHLPTLKRALVTIY